MDPEVVRSLFRALAHESVDYVLVGAVALDVLGIGRLTQDIDLFVRPTEDNIARVRRALRSIWDDASIDQIEARDLVGEYPVVQYGAPDGTRVDLMSRLRDVFGFDDLESRVCPFGGVPVVVATPETLYAMKRDTVRLQDRADAQRLQRKFGLKDNEV